MVGRCVLILGIGERILKEFQLSSNTFKLSVPMSAGLQFTLEELKTHGPFSRSPLEAGVEGASSSCSCATTTRIWESLFRIASQLGDSQLESGGQVLSRTDFDLATFCTRFARASVGSTSRFGRHVSRHGPLPASPVSGLLGEGVLRSHRRRLWRT